MTDYDITAKVYGTTITNTVNDINITVRLGATVASLTSVDSDILLSLEGTGADTGFKFNSTTRKIEVYVDNVKVAELN